MSRLQRAWPGTVIEMFIPERGMRMYNVMLVDDDYPVIELLSEAISWNELGLNLMGSYENGMSAWEDAKSSPPDILITDIGMPKMNGLELSARIKEVKADVRIAILSCHNESNMPSRLCA